jgi:transcriptional regulator of heat shock response
LFTKPELHEASRTATLSQALDKLNDILEALMRKEGNNDVEVILGEDSPFGPDFGALVIRFSRGEISQGLIGILGLLRMDWEKNMGLMKYVKSLMNG